jgi:hypothetical protein
MPKVMNSLCNTHCHVLLQAPNLVTTGGMEGKLIIWDLQTLLRMDIHALQTTSDDLVAKVWS